MEEYYRPLPKSLTIKSSGIEGLGLFALEPIKKETNLGISHRSEMDDNFDEDYIRTPLGGFINHSEKPNCELVWKYFGYELWTLEEIKKGEELTLKYKMYNPTK
jgi:SET domain-containing protein